MSYLIKIEDNDFMKGIQYSLKVDVTLFEKRLNDNLVNIKNILDTLVSNVDCVIEGKETDDAFFEFQDYMDNEIEKEFSPFKFFQEIKDVLNIKEGQIDVTKVYISDKIDKIFRSYDRALLNIMYTDDVFTDEYKDKRVSMMSFFMYPANYSIMKKEFYELENVYIVDGFIIDGNE
mgnify:CR=1 FL=1|jgi:hypothetical protein